MRTALATKPETEIMAIARTITVHVPAIEKKLPRVYAVTWLCNAAGKPVTALDQLIPDAKGYLGFTAADLFNCDDEALARAAELEEAGALFVSCLDDRGESML